MAWKKHSVQVGRLAEGLVKIGALQFGTYTLPDGSESSYYINLRGLPSYPGVYRLVVDAMTSLVSTKTPKADALCGIPITGLTFASPIALELGKPLVYTRLARQAGEKVVEGEMRPGWKVVMVDDLVTTGKSIISSAKAVEQEGGDASQAVVLIDRAEGARERLSKKGIALHAFTDVIELADTLYSMELITESNLKSITRAVEKRPSRP
ncbi:MAG TPA: phosphoribosyltransferase family protein [Nitrososphaerales archaeon]|nr:phosphoribosyltransferase family protein [Nitrososphaerales archaeon]